MTSSRACALSLYHFQHTLRSEFKLICIVLSRYVHQQVLDDFLHERAAFIARFVVVFFRHDIKKIKHTATMRFASVRCAALVLRQLPFLQPVDVTVLRNPCQCRRLTGHSRRRQQKKPQGNNTRCKCEWILFCFVFFWRTATRVSW